MTCDGESPIWSNVPFFSNVPVINSQFRNVHFNANEADTCRDGECPAACAKTACPACHGNLACDAPACRADTHLQLASHQEAASAKTDSTRDDLMQQLMEMHVENARLQAEVEAMAHHMELMEEMYNVRAENAALRAQLNLIERYKAETTK